MHPSHVYSRRMTRAGRRSKSSRATWHVVFLWSSRPVWQPSGRRLERFKEFQLPGPGARSTSTCLEENASPTKRPFFLSFLLSNGCLGEGGPYEVPAQYLSGQLLEGDLGFGFAPEVWWHAGLSTAEFGFKLVPLRLVAVSVLSES